MFEHKLEPLVPQRKFVIRILRCLAVAGGIVFVSLVLGILGYHFFEGLSWLDALLNASMILTGMGPADQLHTTGGKLFASFYALFSGIVLITTAGFLLAPLMHRLMHKFHLESKEDDAEAKAKPDRRNKPDKA
jgi:hypothetical protein